ncbi:MAG: beta-glucosidase [Spirochaetales bacterium]|nr:beta-glucosidase [Spirochaetales bacterium]
MFTRPVFPEDFLIGTATASYQVEGAASEDGRTPCIWDEFAKVPGKVFEQQDGSIAADQYHRYKEDIELMSKLGFGAYRFSVSWSRVLPHGATTINKKGIQYYKNLCEELHRHNMKACCTIYHWDMPSEIQAKGGWANRQTAYDLTYLAETLFRELGDLVDMWITINEAMCVTFLGYLLGIHAPGVKDKEQFRNAVHHINLAHGLIVLEYRKTGLKAPIGITHNLEIPRPASSSPKDRIAVERHMALRTGLFMDPIFKKKYPDYVINELKWQFPIENGDFDIISEPIDFLGLNYYSEHALRWSDTAPDNIEHAPRWEERMTGIGWNITPHGLMRLLKWTSAYTGGKLPIYITENGAACDDRITEETEGNKTVQRVHDNQRVRYLSDHLNICAQAIREGVPLKGYFCWSFIDNYEWTKGYSQRFGIVYCDYETQNRIPKDSAYYLRDVMAGYGD